MFPVGLALLLTLFAIAAPPPAGDCVMAMDSSPSGSLSAPDCCTDRSCPRMAPEPPRPEGLIGTTAALAPLSLVGELRSSPTPISPLVAVAHRVLRDDLPGPPLRI